MTEQGTAVSGVSSPGLAGGVGSGREGVDMTQNRRSKGATRSRMAETGEKYTEARRALLASGGDLNGAGEEPGVAVLWPDDSLGWFTDQAYNLIVLAEDEARMLSHSSVEPEHLLLATTRRGNVQRLLAGLDHAIHDRILQIHGFGRSSSSAPGARRPARRCFAERLSRRPTGGFSARAPSICYLRSASRSAQSASSRSWGSQTSSRSSMRNIR